MKKNESQHFDVVVVGAGASGLQAARELHQQGFSVKVLEARSRVGGRTYTVTVPETKNPVDLGGQWFGPDHDHALKLIKEFGLTLNAQFDEGTHILELHGHRFNYHGNISELAMFARPEDAKTPASALTDRGFMRSGSLPNSPVSSSTEPELDRVWAQLDAYAAELNLDSDTPLGHGPAMTSERYRDWDQVTMRSWCEANIASEGSRKLVEWFFCVCMAADMSEVSLLSCLVFLAQGGGYAKLANVHGGAQQDTLLEGAQAISDGLLARLPAGMVQVNAPVTTVQQDGEGVTVWFAMPTSPGSGSGSGSDSEAKDGEELLRPQLCVRARRVIMSVPAPLCQRIRFSPRLPAMREQLQARMPMGCVIKVNVFYPRAFWREMGMSGEVISDLGPLSLTYDKTINGSAALLGFIAGSAARLWGQRTQQERRTAVLEQLQRLFKTDEALSPSAYIDHDWLTEYWSGGCYFANMGPGTRSECAATLRQPVGRVHWAGTETARFHSGYIDGALESGVRAAAEVTAALRPRLLPLASSAVAVTDTDNTRAQARGEPAKPASSLPLRARL